MPTPKETDYSTNTTSTPIGRRRRTLNALPLQSDGNSSALLPTTYSPSQGGMSSPKQFPTSNTCNNFLLGGTYYPGKDKHRRHIQRRTLWYRLFCSSTWRKVLSLFVASYFLFYIFIRPFTSTVLQYGNFLVSGRRRNHGMYATWLLNDQSLLGKFQSNIEEEREEALHLAAERHKLQYGPEARRAARLKTIERIVPGWFHRNDKDAANNKVVEAKLKEAERAMEHKEQPQRRGTDTQDKQDTPPQDSKIDPQDTEQRRLINPSLASVSQSRTLHNMHLFGNMSSCPSTIPSTDIRTTLVLQSTPDRLWILKETCKRWKDPIVLTVFLVPDETFPADTIVPSGTCPQLTIITHTMDASLGEDGKEMYPVNRLRNIGLDAVQTSHVLMTDIDFVPSSDLHMLIHSTLTERYLLRQQHSESLPPENREALVVPAFEQIPPADICPDEKCPPEVHQNLTKLVVPHSFEELHACVLDRKECRVFQSHNNWDGHSSTRSESWLKGEWYDKDSTDEQAAATHSRRIKTLQCFDSVRYEPYVILRWCPSNLEQSPTHGPLAPYYDERFHGYGKNKIEMISHLRIMGYRFSILPEGFIIHAPHSISNAKRAWESTKDSSLHANMDKLYPKFLKELLEVYKHEQYNIVKACGHS